MQFSIVIPSSRRLDLLASCLTSVQRYAPRGTEIIVVDDASVRCAVSAMAGRFPGVRVLRLARREGFCAAVNVGVAAASGMVVELLNDDTEVMRGWADTALQWFADSTIGAVAPLVLQGPKGQVIDSAGDRYFPGGVAAKRGRGKPAAAARMYTNGVFGASGSSAFYRRESLMRVGGFPEQFGAYFDDVDVAFRLKRAGLRTVFEPESRVLHVGSASYGRPEGRLLEQQSLNEERVFWRNVPNRDLTWALPAHLAVLLAKTGRRWGEGALAPFLRGRLRILCETKEILRHRRWLAKLEPGNGEPENSPKPLA